MEFDEIEDYENNPARKSIILQHLEWLNEKRNDLKNMASFEDIQKEELRLVAECKNITAVQHYRENTSHANTKNRI